MKNLYIIFAAALFTGLLASCVEDRDTPQEIWQQDLKKIEAYINSTDYQYLKLDQDETTGIAILWGDISYSGIKAERGDTVLVDYYATLLNGQFVDTSIESIARKHGRYNSDREYEPLKYRFLYDNLISGFVYGVSEMEEGDSTRVLIPSYYAYGNTEFEGVIPANSVLVYDMMIREIKKPTVTTTVE